MKRFVIVAFVLLFLVAIVSYKSSKARISVAFINGQIHTINADDQVVEAMLVEGNRIKALGTTDNIKSLIRQRTQIIDLNGRHVLPGFVDAHSHFPASGIRAVSVDLSPSPIGDTDTVEALLARVQNAAKAQSNTDWILGYNYDNTALANGQHPTRAQLDSVVSEQPVYLWHSSGHMGVANSKALEALSIEDGNVAPFGGSYGVDPLTGKLNGLLQEKAAPPLSNIIKEYSYKQQLEILTSARDEYLAAGVTTVQNGFAGVAQMRVLRAAQWIGLIDQRVVVWPSHKKKAVKHNPRQANKSHVKFITGAVKILVDGSPQGFTAYLSEPYFNRRSYPEGYRGIALIPQPRLTELVMQYHRDGYQLALHGNGDAAIESIIVAVEAAQADYPRPDARHIIAHAQTIRKDQIQRLKAASITPSFFNSHTYFWGDWHRQQSLGPERAENISPAKWAQEAGVRFSLHTDAPVTPMNPMQMLWSATKRQTLSGFTLGSEQRIDTQAALRALTIDAAWQSKLENELGSLELGKLADVVVLSDSPFDVEDVRQISVLATFIGGVKRYGDIP